MNEDDDLGTMYSALFWNRIIATAAPIVNIPVQYRDTLKLSQFEQKLWRSTMEEEIKSLNKHKVWDLVNLPPGHTPVKGRWVYAVKSNGRKKACFIAKGFTQIYGIDFEETFSPVTRFETVRLLLSISALDVKTGFLFGELDEDIYIYGTAQRFHPKGSREESLLLMQDLLWFETSRSTMEQGLT